MNLRIDALRTSGLCRRDGSAQICSVRQSILHAGMIGRELIDGLGHVGTAAERISVMMRRCRAVMAITLGMGVTGCSYAPSLSHVGHYSIWHCDECDDFPTPAYGPAYSMMPGSYTTNAAQNASEPKPPATVPNDFGAAPPPQQTPSPMPPATTTPPAAPAAPQPPATTTTPPVVPPAASEPPAPTRHQRHHRWRRHRERPRSNRRFARWVTSTANERNS